MTHSCTRLRPLHGSLEASRGKIVSSLDLGIDVCHYPGGCHAPNSTGVIYVTILPPDFFFPQLESKLHLE